MLTLLLLLAAPPQFTVTNRCPPVFVVTNKFPAAPVVAAPKTFRSGIHYDPDHRCDKCGSYQNRISGYLPGGQHTHTCAACGFQWKH